MHSLWEQERLCHSAPPRKSRGNVCARGEFQAERTYVTADTRDSDQDMERINKNVMTQGESGEA